MFNPNASGVGAAAPGHWLAAAMEMIGLPPLRGAHAVGVEVKRLGRNCVGQRSQISVMVLGLGWSGFSE
jgi:hypothetical protein